MHVNLKARRCPDAQVLINRLLDAFYQSVDTTLTIESIEPSLVRNINGRIAGMELPLKIVSVAERPITESDITSWKDEFDDEDYGDVQIVQTISIERA